MRSGAQPEAGGPEEEFDGAPSPAAVRASDAELWAQHQQYVLQQQFAEQQKASAQAHALADAQAGALRAREEAEEWRSRAEAAERRMGTIMPLISATCTTCEEMLSRLAQAKSLGEVCAVMRVILTRARCGTGRLSDGKGRSPRQASQSLRPCPPARAPVHTRVSPRPLRLPRS